MSFGVTSRYAAMAFVVVVAAASTGSANAAVTPPSVIAFDQKLEGSKLSVAYAYLPSNGYLVVYGSDDAGEPNGKVLGHTDLNAGDHRNVVVSLSDKLPKGAHVWIGLYSDKDQKPGFDPKADAPFWSDRLPPINRLTVQ